MIINFIAIRSDDPYTASVDGDKITIEGEVFDFTPLPEGATLPASAISSPRFFGSVSRHGGAIEVTLFSPHGANAPASSRQNSTKTVLFGEVPFPEYDTVQEEPVYEEEV
ncbi:hypothetical protein PMW_147 [Pseudomonas phage phiPMW]|uniref:Uncharacterized protein n=1 Tax=Pseudomonas phage phiPMW TaxID=1815582 RepID=A0A1S5R1H2_9CAUD|nr:hypothetical protein FDG97_gp203 [Pseudomonas phage phiPMW]ANA49272.1 hypothetical protein PMW_147 [Pseudomonas phage phiPMW]